GDGKKKPTPTPTGRNTGAPAAGGKTTGGKGGSAAGGGSAGTNPGGGSADSGGAAANGGGAGGSRGPQGGGGNPPPAPPAPVCHGIGAGKYNCEVWRTSDSIRAGGDHAGKLNAGTNYFYCQANLGRRVTYGNWTNVWWAKTDDDSGNTNVYVSVVYLKGGDNDKALPGLPTC
ncbi:serine/threonine protein kinase, partial [Streptomyces sp. NPDC054863]